MTRPAFVFVAVAALACGPDVFDGDPFDAAFDADVLYVCHRWRPGPGPPPVEWGLFDLEGVDVQRVLEANGLVVHEFNVPAVRAVLRPSEVPGTGARRARGVTAPYEYEVDVEVRFTSDDSTRQAALLDSAGAEVRNTNRRLATWELLWRVTIADAAIPGLRDHEEVASVELELFACLS